MVTPVPISEPAPVPTRMRAGSEKTADADRRSPPVAHRPGGFPHPLRRWATVPELRPPAAVRPAKVPRAGDVPDRPARVMRPAGGLSAPRAHPGRMGRASCPPAAASPPMSPWGGFGGREQIYGRRCAALVFVSHPPPAPPVPGGVRGVAAKPPAPRRLPHAASARPGLGLSPAFHRAAPPCPFRRRPRPARAPSAPPPPDRPRCHAASARPASAPSSRVRAAPPGLRPFRAGPRPARAPRPPPARAAARPPCRSGRGLHRAASMRPVRLIIHIFTVPEIPYFTGFSARQAR